MKLYVLGMVVTAALVAGAIVLGLGLLFSLADYVPTVLP